MTKLRDKFIAISDEMKSGFFERDRLVDAALTAILAKHHVLQLGVPGTAKSMLTVNVCNRVVGGSYFEWLLTRFSVPEELFGPPSMKGMQEDDYRRIITNKLPEAHIVFLDEIFKANAAILNSMLTVINERKFDNGRQRIDVPLISVFGASNELPQEEELVALYDRFLLRFDVRPIQDGSNWEELLKRADVTRQKDKVTFFTTITLEELEEAQADAMHTPMPDEVIGKMREIKMALEANGIFASDRRWFQTVGVLQCWAWLRGHDEVEVQDLDLLCDMLWNEPEQRTILVEQIMAVVNPLDLEAVKLYDTLLDVYAKWDKTEMSSTEECAAKLKRGIDQLDAKLVIANPALTDKMTSVREDLRGWYQTVLTSYDL